MIGQRLRMLRKEAKITQDELGARLGTTRSVICSYETNAINPPYNKMKALADIFDVSVGYLNGETNIRKEVVVDDSDIAEHLKKTIDILSNVDYQVNFDGVEMTIEQRNVALEQLNQTVRYIKLLEQLKPDNK